MLRPGLAAAQMVDAGVAADAYHPGLEAVALRGGEAVVGGILDVGEVAGQSCQLDLGGRGEQRQGLVEFALHQALAVHAGLDLEVEAAAAGLQRGGDSGRM